jgi:hypothetical protein
MGLKLFIELAVNDIFHFHDKPERKLVKSDDRHYVAPEGRRVISPSVAVMKDDSPKNQPTYLNQKKEG